MENYNKISGKMYKHLVQQKLQQKVQQNVQQKVHSNNVALFIKRFLINK